MIPNFAASTEALILAQNFSNPPLIPLPNPIPPLLGTELRTESRLDQSADNSRLSGNISSEFRSGTVMQFLDQRLALPDNSTFPVDNEPLTE